MLWLSTGDAVDKPTENELTADEVTALASTYDDPGKAKNLLLAAGWPPDRVPNFGHFSQPRDFWREVGRILSDGQPVGSRRRIIEEVVKELPEHPVLSLAPSSVVDPLGPWPAPAVDAEFSADPGWIGRVEGLIAQIRARDERTPGDQAGRWPSPVQRVRLLRLIPAAAGAEILDAEVTHVGGALRRLMIKIDEAREIRKEWAAYRAHLMPSLPVEIAPVYAVAEPVRRDVLAGQAGAPGSRAMIVYQAVGDFDGAGPDAISLNELVIAALRKPTDQRATSQAVLALTALLGALRTALRGWSLRDDPRRTLFWQNPEMGPDLVILVDHARDESSLAYARRTDAVLQEPADLVRLNTEPAQPGCGVPRDKPRGTPARLVDLTFERDPADFRELRAYGDTASAVVRLVGDDDGRLPDLRRFAGRRSVQVDGEVQEVRVETYEKLIVETCPGFSWMGGLLVGGSEDKADAVRHPLSALYAQLAHRVPDRKCVAGHGDLRPRGVLFAGGKIFFTGFADARADRPLYSDLAWLEICLLRGTIGAALGWRQTVRLCRLLAVSSRFAGSGEVDLSRELAGAAPELRMAFGLLGKLRRVAAAWWPAGSPRPWWEDYLTQLTIASCRSVAFGGQPAREVQAAVAAAGVAAEWLGDRDPFQNWPESELLSIARALVGGLHVDAPAAPSAVALLVTALGRSSSPQLENADLWRALLDRRAALVRHRFGADLEALVTEDERAALVGMGLQGDLYEPGETDPRSVGDAVTMTLARAAVVVRGAWGSGTSTVGRQVRLAVARAALAWPVGDAPDGETRTDGAPMVVPRLPLVRDANAVAAALSQPARAQQGDSPSDLLRAQVQAVLPELGDDPVTWLTMGAVHLTVDGLNEVADEADATGPSARVRVADWIATLRRAFPRNCVVVCFGTDDDLPEKLSDFHGVALRGLTKEQIRPYVRDRLELAGRQRSAADRQAATVVRQVFAGGDGSLLPELAGRPFLLKLLIDRFAATSKLQENVGDLLRAAVEAMLAGAPGGRAAAAQPLPDDDPRTLVLENLALRMVTDRAVSLRADAARAEVRKLSQGRGDPDEMLALLCRSGLLRHAAEGPYRFSNHGFQQYFAARILHRKATGPERDATVLHDLVQRFSWTEPFMIMLGFSGGQPDLAMDLVPLVDPRRAASVLRGVASLAPEANKVFLGTQRDTLGNEYLGVHAWKVAASALATLASPDARAVLRDVATGQAALLDVSSRDAPLDARSAALRELAALAVASRAAGDVRTDEAAELTTAVGALLTMEAPERLSAEAAAAAGDAKLHGLDEQLNALIGVDRPWPVVRAAWNALTVIGADLGPATANYLAACAARLTDTVDELRQVTVVRDVSRLQNEGRALLDALAGEGRLGLLLEHRFSCGVGDDGAAAGSLSWSERLCRDRFPEPAEGEDRLWDLLYGEQSPDDLVELFPDRSAGQSPVDELALAAAGHRLLTDHRGQAENLLRRASRDSPVIQLLVAAQAAGLAGAELAGPAVRSVVTELVRLIIDRSRNGDRPEADDGAVRNEDLLEALAALIGALLPDDIQTKIVIGWAMSELVDLPVKASRRGPLAAAWFAARWPSDAEFSRMLTDTFPALADVGLGTDECVASALFYLGNWSALDVAGESRHVDLTVAACERIEGYEPTATPWISRYVRTCVTAHLWEHGLRYVLLHLRYPAQDLAAIHESADDEFLLEDRSEMGMVLASVGYLGLAAHEDGNPRLARMAWHYLKDLRTDGLDPTSRRGLGVGLAVLGDFDLLLEDLPSGDPRWHQAAINAIRWWAGGPYPARKIPQVDKEIAERILQRLDEPDLAPDVRSTLCEIKELLEQRLGYYLPLM